MKTVDLSKLVDIEFGEMYTFDSPNFADAYVTRAVDEETGEELTQEELDYLNENYKDFIYATLLQSLF